MKTADIGSIDVSVEDGHGLVVESMAIPEMTSQAEMIEGGADAVAERLASIIAERGLVPGGVR